VDVVASRVGRNVGRQTAIAVSVDAVGDHRLVALLDGAGVAGAAASYWTVLNDPLAEKMKKHLIDKNWLEKNDEMFDFNKHWLKK
jgi:hypothetical protein